MIVSIHQPEHLPWLGFFHKMMNSDVFVLLDTVPYRKSYFQNRNKVFTANGSKYVTIPVNKQNELNLIKDIKIDTQFHKRKYLKTIYYAYKNHPYFDQYYDRLEKIISKEFMFLVDLNIEIIKFFKKELGIQTKLIKASELNVAGSKSKLLLNICKELEADCYLSGPSGRDYLDESLFKEADIGVEYHNFDHPVYPQIHSTQFISHLSTMDLLFNCGEQSKQYLKK